MPPRQRNLTLQPPPYYQPNQQENLYSSTNGRSPHDGAGEDVGVGLFAPAQSGARRRMLDVMNRLHDTGVQLDIAGGLPMIAVVGSQSAGKSSLIEAISGITLPRDSGTCTRCPTECRLSYSSQPWKCIVSLRWMAGGNGSRRDEPFGDPILDKREVEGRIRRAQRAILNPNTDSSRFLNGRDENPASSELTFSQNCVALQISGRDLTDLSFCDLPGLIAAGREADIDLIKSLAVTHIQKPSCIILLAMACETDFQNQGAHRLARQYDPEGKRTIGVLTKPDRIQRGDEEQWLKYIQNDTEETLENGWFAVKQPNPQALANKITWAEAREEERIFFSSTEPWSSARSCQPYFGTQNLNDRLSTTLCDHIRQGFPKLQEEIQALLEKTNKSLADLPSPPTSDPVSEVVRLVNGFTRDLALMVDGVPEGGGLLQTIGPLQHQFRKAIRETAPDFRPFEATSGGDQDFFPPSFLSHEEQTPPVSPNSTAMYIDQVMKLARDAKTRELPGNYPFVVRKNLITKLIKSWDRPAHAMFEKIFGILSEFVNRTVSKHFGQHTQGGLLQRVMITVAKVLKDCYENTQNQINWFLKAEESVFTLNEHYFADYRDKFLAYYRDSRYKGQNLPSTNGHSQNSPVASRIYNGVVNGSPVSIADSSRILSSDPYEPALLIMADVRAYFQVAYKRFCDNVPMAIDQELLRGLDSNGSIEGALLQGLGVGGPEGHKVCKDLLQEPRHITSRREELVQKQQRLEAAKTEILQLL